MKTLSLTGVLALSALFFASAGFAADSTLTGKQVWFFISHQAPFAPSFAGSALVSETVSVAADSQRSEANEVITRFGPKPVDGEAVNFLTTIHSKLTSQKDAHTFLYAVTYTQRWADGITSGISNGVDHDIDDGDYTGTSTVYTRASDPIFENSEINLRSNKGGKLLQIWILQSGKERTYVITYFTKAQDGTDQAASLSYLELDK